MTTSEPISPPDSNDRYRVHPLLDPLLPSRQPALARLWMRSCQRILDDPEVHAQALQSFRTPIGGTQATCQSLSRYLHDADAYIDDILGLLGPEEAQPLGLMERTRAQRELRDVLENVLEGPHPRARYEAQRKLYLAKLLFDVDHCRAVRDGPRHRAFFESLLDRELWPDLEEGHVLEICCELVQDRSATQHLKIGVPPHPGARCWRFRPRSLRGVGGEPDIEIYDYRSRFKREVRPVEAELSKDGLLNLSEAPRWPGLGRRSGSTASKMLRRGIGDPSMVSDLLGAMFIVGSHKQTYALERRLIDALGGAFRWRDRVDTLADEADRDRLDPNSARGFQVIKSLVDILIEDPASSTPYMFTVEIQIFPLAAYLSTLHDEHFASHVAYKRRQFLNALLPMLFPTEVFDSIDRADGNAAPNPQ